MRTVILGTDFSYDKDGNLKPIEINTATGWQYVTLENESQKIDLTDLKTFVQTRQFNKIVYIGGLLPLKHAFDLMCIDLEIEFVYLEVSTNSITIPNVEDNEQTLIIRSAYDTTAIVDDTYCANKVNFLNLIKDTNIGGQFAYIDETGNLVSNITNIPDNGQHPNFILKSVTPGYDENEYPKLYKVSNQSELNTILQNVSENYFLMEYYFNANKLYEGNQITVIRSFDLLFPPNLQSIPLAKYTTLTSKKLTTPSVFDSETFELINDRRKYISSEMWLRKPKLIDTDKVVMADGSLKTPLEFEAGEYVKTIDIPNPNNIDLISEIGNFNIDLNTFISGSSFSTNRIVSKERVDVLTKYATLTFTDGTDWEDTEGSSYLINRDNNIQFASITEPRSNGYIPEYGIKPGDKIILVNTNSEEFSIIEKEVVSTTVQRTIFSGWIIEVERKHIFLTQNSEGESYVAIEHNVACDADNCNCFDPGGCSKGLYCTQGNRGNSGLPCCGWGGACSCKTICVVSKL
jgi:hypothetical protein